MQQEQPVVTEAVERTQWRAPAELGIDEATTRRRHLFPYLCEITSQARNVALAEAKWDDTTWFDPNWNGSSTDFWNEAWFGSLAKFAEKALPDGWAVQTQYIGRTERRCLIRAFPYLAEEPDEGDPDTVVLADEDADAQEFRILDPDTQEELYGATLRRLIRVLQLLEPTICEIEARAAPTRKASSESSEAAEESTDTKPNPPESE